MPTAQLAFNWVEAVLWGAMGLACLVASPRSKAPGAMAVLGITLVAFGLSDLVETRTGAWWRPWWLLVWKALCLVVIAACLARWWRSRRT